MGYEPAVEINWIELKTAQLQLWIDAVTQRWDRDDTDRCPSVSVAGHRSLALLDNTGRRQHKLAPMASATAAKVLRVARRRSDVDADRS